MLDIYLIRHAESEMNSHNNLVGGRSEGTPLSEKGKYQAALLGKRLSNSGIIFNELYSSTSKRAVETAEIVGTQLNYSLDSIIKFTELSELDQGSWEGKPRIEIYTPEVLAEINKNNWNFTPPNGESQKNVEERMLKWTNENLITRYANNLTVGIFTHGLAVKCLLRGIMDFSPKITYKIILDNTSITRLKYSDNGWHLISLNDTAHLLSEEKNKK